MKCSPIIHDGIRIILCGSERFEACDVCGGFATKLCDWKVGNSGTCSRGMCDTHAHSVGKNRDLCFQHMNAWSVHPANKQMTLAL
jgi:hypothetical protein